LLVASCQLPVKAVERLIAVALALQLVRRTGNLKLELETVFFGGWGGLLSNLSDLGGRLPLTLWEVDGALQVFKDLGDEAAN